MRGDQIDMAEFLAFALRCVDEDQRVAQAAAAKSGYDEEPGTGHWKPNNPGCGGGAIEDHNGSIVVYDEGAPSEDQAEHIARWDPQQVLRLAGAMRLMINEYSHEGRETTMLIELVTALYESRPGWREEWAS